MGSVLWIKGQWAGSGAQHRSASVAWPGSRWARGCTRSVEGMGDDYWTMSTVISGLYSKLSSTRMAQPRCSMARCCRWSPGLRRSEAAVIETCAARVLPIGSLDRNDCRGVATRPRQRSCDDQSIVGYVRPGPDVTCSAASAPMHENTIVNCQIH